MSEKNTYLYLKPIYFDILWLLFSKDLFYPNLFAKFKNLMVKWILLFFLCVCKCIKTMNRDAMVYEMKKRLIPSFNFSRMATVSFPSKTEKFNRTRRIPIHSYAYTEIHM